MTNNDGAPKFPNYDDCCQIGERVYVVTGNYVVEAFTVLAVRATIYKDRINLEYLINALEKRWMPEDSVFNNPVDAFNYFKEIDDA